MVDRSSFEHYVQGGIFLAAVLDFAVSWPAPRTNAVDLAQTDL